MRIISPFKDYYDHVGKVYRDEDPRAYVWERHTGVVTAHKDRRVDRWGFWNSADYNEYRFLLGDSVLIFFEEIGKEGLYSFQEGFQHTTKTSYRRGTQPIFLRPIKEQIELQLKHRTPIIMIQFDHYTVNPKLTDYNLQRIYDKPELVYQDCERWLTDGKFSEEKPNKQTNKQKIVSHGLDLKLSFRNRK